MDTPVHERGGICRLCNKPNYGLGACKNHYRRVHTYLLKTALVKLMGGKCKKCHRKYPIAVFDFHHRNPKNKKFGIGNALNNRGWESLVKEALKCDLLCANCHRMITHQEEIWRALT